MSQYGVIYMDPPWEYQMYSDKGKMKSPDMHYKCMSMEDLRGLRDDVLFKAAENCVCVMWTTFAFLDQAIALMKHYGFQYKTGGPWVKRTKNLKNAFGTGYILRSSAEIFLIGTIGQPKIKSKSIRNVMITGDARFEDIGSIIVDMEMREHSRKPDEMISMIEALFSGPYLEMFARTKRAGWDVWGNEIDKFN